MKWLYYWSYDVVTCRERCWAVGLPDFRLVDFIAPVFTKAEKLYERYCRRNVP